MLNMEKMKVENQNGTNNLLLIKKSVKTTMF